LALERVSSAHGAMATGLIPEATAGMAVVMVGERPRPAYWIALGVGLAAVVSLPVIQGARALQVGDLLLLAAVVSVGFGYVHGGVLARKYGRWRVDLLQTKT
jgi:drug/metabolite transporter (DMT)-like permease